MALALAVNLMTNRVPKSWRWASNGWLLIAVVAGLTLVGAALAWWHQPIGESSRRSLGRVTGYRADRQLGAGNVPVQPWQLWAAAFGTSTLAVGLAILAQLGKSAGTNEVTAVLIVVVGLIALTVTLAWRASGEQVTSADIDSSRAGWEAKITPRQLLLEKIDQWWIRDALHRSLQQAVQLEVGLDSQPDALADRFDDEWGTGRLQRLGASDPLPPGTRLRTLLGHGRHRRCLVIGEPGSGKTTHLLQLTEDLLGDAEADPDAPIPVVLLLSRWTAGHPDLHSWVSAEIGERYDIVPSQVNQWLAAGSLTLLLDGLDEVGPNLRNGCLQALNTFSRDHGYAGVGLVLTCRTRDYESLDERLRFDVAVRVRPLDAGQVDHALLAAGQDLDGLRQSVTIDRAVAELLTTPLMLGVAVLAYRGAPANTPLLAGGSEQLRGVLYGEFIQRMLGRDRSLRRSREAPMEDFPFEQHKAYSFLVWLAKMMLRQQQTVFYPDWLTPAWLPNRKTEWALPRIGGFTGWLATKLGWDHTSTGIVGARLAALIGAAAAAPIGALARGPWGALLLAVACGTFLGLGVGITFGVLLQLPSMSWLFVPLIGSEDEDPYAASSWTWSWRHALRGLLLRSALGMIVIGVPLGILLSWAAGVAVALVLGLGGALSAGTVPDFTEPPASPGRALHASLWLFARLLALLMTATILAAALEFALNGPWTAIVASLPMTGALMLTAGPGRAWLRNQAVNFGISKAQMLPPNVITFLQYADERVILQRTFGGFAFIHRTLRDYLADQEGTREILPYHS